MFALLIPVLCFQQDLLGLGMDTAKFPVFTFVNLKRLFLRAPAGTDTF